MAILALFEQFLGKFCLNFLPLKSEYFTIYDAFCSYIFDYACLGLIGIEKVRNYGKLCSSNTCLKMAGGGECTSPGSAHARTDNNVSYHYTKQPIWLQYDAGQILSKLFLGNCTYYACTVCRPTLYFKSKGSVSKGGFRPPNPPWRHWCN